MKIVVKVEHLPVVVRFSSPFERLDDLEKHLETLSHRKVAPKIFRCQKSMTAELLGLSEIGLDQAAGGVRALHHSAPLLGQGVHTIQLTEQITGPVVLPTTSPPPDESSRLVILLRPELVMEMGDQQSTFGRFGSGHFSGVLRREPSRLVDVLVLRPEAVTYSIHRNETLPSPYPRRRTLSRRPTRKHSAASSRINSS